MFSWFNEFFLQTLTFKYHHSIVLYRCKGLKKLQNFTTFHKWESTYPWSPQVSTKHRQSNRWESTSPTPNSAKSNSISKAKEREMVRSLTILKARLVIARMCVGGCHVDIKKINKTKKKNIWAFTPTFSFTHSTPLISLLCTHPSPSHFDSTRSISLSLSLSLPPSHISLHQWPPSSTLPSLEVEELGTLLPSKGRMRYRRFYFLFFAPKFLFSVLFEKGNGNSNIERETQRLGERKRESDREFWRPKRCSETSEILIFFWISDFGFRISDFVPSSFLNSKS